MTKKVLTFGILLIILAGVFTPSVVLADACTQDQLSKGYTNVTMGTSGVVACQPPTDNSNFSIAGWLAQKAGNATFGPVVTVIGYLLMLLSSMALAISGWIFDSVVSYTVVDMAGKLNNPNGIGGAISSSWNVLRDIANMGFIFILLYAAFKTMFDSNFGNFSKTIINIIIIALLINFSLFFSKIVIDASNIVSVGFYKAIAGSYNDVTAIKNPFGGTGGTGSTANFKGISGGYMRMLGLQTWYDPGILVQNGFDFQKILVTGVMSSIFMLVSAVIFLVAGVMLAARFIILVFLLILSPLAFIAYATPGLKGRFDEWLSALINQSFFAPLYFALTWVTFRLGNSLKPTGSWIDIISDPKKLSAVSQEASISLLLNYVLVIGFSIAALIFAKQMASKTKYFGTISGGIGAATIGGAAWATRNTIGRGAANIASNKDLQERAARGDIGARMTLASAKKLAGSSFDVRGVGDTKYGKMFGVGDLVSGAGKAGGVGGYKGAVDSKDEKRRKRTDDVMKRFRNQPEILADHLESLSFSDQRYMYDKLSSRDRAAIDEVLDKKYGTTGGANATTKKLRDTLSPEEKEKTEKAGKEVAKDAKNKERLDEINKIATDPVYATTLTPTAIDTIVKQLPNSLARKLSSASRRSPLIIPSLTVRHLADLMSEGDLTTDEIDDIKTNATAGQIGWMSDPVRKALWDIP